MSGVTDADRERAASLLNDNRPWDRVGAIAAALAEERQKARAPFLALAEHYLTAARRRGLPDGGELAMVAAAIRRAAEADE